MRPAQVRYAGGRFQGVGRHSADGARVGGEGGEGGEIARLLGSPARLDRLPERVGREPNPVKEGLARRLRD